MLGILLNDISQSFPVHPQNSKQKYDACVTNSSSPKRICIVMVICFPGCFPSAVTHPACSSSPHESVRLVKRALSYLLGVGVIVLKRCRAPEVQNTIAWLKLLHIYSLIVSWKDGKSKASSPLSMCVTDCFRDYTFTWTDI